MALETRGTFTTVVPDIRPESSHHRVIPLIPNDGPWFIF